MKKLRKSIFFMLIALCAVSFTTSDLKAQSFEKGDFDLNVQLGFGTRWYYSYSSYVKMGLPFISVAGDYALIDSWGPGVFGVGALIGVNTLKYDNYYLSGDYKNTNFSIVPRATYHYQFVDKLDTYAGLATGIKIRSYSGDYTPGNEVDFVITAFAGVKYYFTDNFSVMSEIYVYDLALFNIGVGLKF